MGRLGIREKKWVALQPRDYALVAFLSEQKFGTREHVARKFFPGRGASDNERTRPDQVAYRRLLILGQFDLLEKRHVRTDSTQLYQPSRIALGKLSERGEDVLPYLSSIDIRTYEHDRRVTDVRIALEWFGVKSWQSERRLSQSGWKGHRPDATFHVGQNVCGLEMELARKRDDRYPEIFRSIRTEHRELNAVFYLCGSDVVRNAVMAQARKADDAGRYYFATWKDWVDHETNTAFESVRETITFGDIA
jgi:hypothetical protein